ncbi:class I SAM-dependent methyltransferase [Actinoplanes sp. NPDC049802]|uniref:class I SAM-dependent methyltransferase n=1 Tax=Actinoplanes sp. NPDC049802 TaxID=3154742 RepID=UPI0033DDB400
MTAAPQATCRICAGPVRPFIDFGRQPVSDTFPRPEEAGNEVFFHLAAGACRSCTMVQLVEEVPREKMFHADYPYRSSMSSFMVKHFRSLAQDLLGTELTGPDPFLVEIGSNDGTMLRAVAEAGVRHLGVDPGVTGNADARTAGVRVRTAYFEEETARAIAAEEGRADVIFSANTVSHLAYLDSVLRGVGALLTEDGVLILEDRYLGDILRRTAFDQIYDEHFYLFCARSVATLGERFGLELVDVRHLDVHGGSMRYHLARAGRRRRSPAVEELLAQESAAALTAPATLDAFTARADSACTALVELLRRLRAEGRRVVGYGATSKSATVINYGGITRDLIPYVCDSTPVKQGRLLPASHIPILPPSAFGEPYPDYAVLFAWNHAEEIIAKERAFRAAGGRWILYVPEVHVV